jgi:hypothetical protein
VPVTPDANAASFANVIIQVSLGDPDRACEPMSHDVAAPHGPADRIMTELQLVGGLSNG